MPTEIKLPELGENLVSGDVLDIKVAAGDTVSAGQTLMEVEAEKSTVEVPAPFAGKIAQLMVKKGQTIKVGQTLFLLDEANGAPAKTPAKEPAPAAKAESRPCPETSRSKTSQAGDRGGCSRAEAGACGESQRESRCAANGACSVGRNQNGSGRSRDAPAGSRVRNRLGLGFGNGQQ